MCFFVLAVEGSWLSEAVGEAEKAGSGAAKGVEELVGNLVANVEKAENIVRVARVIGGLVSAVYHLASIAGDVDEVIEQWKKLAVIFL